MSLGLDADSLDAQRLTTARLEQKRAHLTAVVLCDHSPQLMQTLLGVLAQQDISLEVLVLCAGECAIQMEQLPGGPHKVRQLRAPAGSSTAAQRNLALTASSSDFLVFVQSGDRLVPGALSKLLAMLKRHPSAGLAHGYWFPVDETGRTTLTEMRARRASLTRRFPIDLNYRRALLTEAEVIQALPTYRRDVLLRSSGFQEGCCECELTTALPLLDVAEIRLLPEFVCARRRRGSWRHFARHASLGFRSRKHQSHLPAWLRYSLPLWLGIGLARHVIYRIKEATIVGFGSILAKCRSLARRWRFRSGLLYVVLRRHLAWWPIAWLHPSGFRGRGPQRKVAYVFWRYPILTETFIRREMKALSETGTSIQIVAEYRGDSTNMPAELFDVCHLSALDPRELGHLSRRVLMRRPLASVNLLLYTVFHDYRLNKSPYTDIDVFRRAARLAAILQTLGVTHVHAPWADSEAFVAKLSAWLLKLPYTVHARAHEIHSRSFNSGIVDNLKGARFVVCNSEYNQRYLRRLLGGPADQRIRVIHNGLDPKGFEVPQRGDKSGSPLSILSVGRLVEQKGFEVLLTACARLRARGISFVVEIIGGADMALDANTFLRLRKLLILHDLLDLVRFRGALPFAEVLVAYSCADLFVLPCIVARDGSHDITPNALLEAMAMELPVISTPVGAIPEIVDDGTNGILSPPNDVDALAAAIERLAHDSDLRISLGRAARDKITRCFNIDRNMKTYGALYAEV